MNTGTYPEAFIDPRDKDKEWLCQYARAAFAEGKTMDGSLFNSASKYTDIRLHRMGIQPIEKYQKILNGDEAVDKTWLVNQNAIYPIIPKYAEIAISKMMQRQFDIQAFAIDETAKTDEDNYYAAIKAKLILKEATQGTPLANSPTLTSEPGEPEDLEELAINTQFGYKHNMAVEAEDAINLVLQNNRIERERLKTIDNLFTIGFGGYKEWIDDAGMVCFRAINPDNIITSYCVQPDFSDASHVGEVLELRLSDLTEYFTTVELQEIQKATSGLYGNASYNNSVTNDAGKWKVQVFDLEILTIDTIAYKKAKDNRENTRFGKTEFKDLQKAPKGDDVTVKGSSTTQTYQVKWVVGTSYAYDCGKSKNQKRKQSKWWDTTLSFHLGSWNFYKMQFTGVIERLIPSADNYQLTKMKLENLKNKLVPYLINIDVDALENVALGDGGKNMSPKELVDFMFQNNVVLYRSKDVGNGNPNYKPASIEASGMLSAFPQLYEDLRVSLQEIQNISGFNELTDGTSVNAKMLNGVARLQEQGTNNALWLMSQTERSLMLGLCDAIIQKVQIAVKLGKVKGYVKALGSETIKLLQVSPDISLHEFGIFLEDAPNDADRDALMQQLNIKDAQGQIDPEDVVMLKRERNLARAEMKLAYKIKKRRQQEQQNAMQNQQMTAQLQAQSAAAAEEEKRKTYSLMSQLKVQEINTQGQWDYIISQEKVSGTSYNAHVMAQAKVIAQKIAASAKNGGMPSIEGVQDLAPKQPVMPPPQQQPPQQQMEQQMEQPMMQEEMQGMPEEEMPQEEMMEQ